jgi:predicted nucleic acid-binding protein
MAAQVLCDLFDCVALDAETADTAARLRRQHRWKLPDAFQAAVAQRRDWLLVTRNEKDFREGRDSFVMVPYRM